jgi:mannose-6-phosphate isomerase-like protein (cupin superfamily)
MVKDIKNLTVESQTTLPYRNHPLCDVNDHVVRMSVMTEAFYWHLHPDSDEVFICVEGRLAIDLEHETIELGPNDLYCVKQGRAHRTRPLTERSVNLTLERAAMQTVRVEPPMRG